MGQILDLMILSLVVVMVKPQTAPVMEGNKKQTGKRKQMKWLKNILLAVQGVMRQLGILETQVPQNHGIL